MDPLLSLFPVYIFGNLHCASMCGPLVMLLSKHPYRHWYFFGRLFSYTICGLLSAEMGLILFSLLSYWHIAAFLSLAFGIWICATGICFFLKVRLPSSSWVIKQSTKFSISVGKLLSHNSYYSVFLFGACTVLLPCGQTIIVFSAIAINGSPLIGLIHGFLFSLLTSPALIAAMHTSQFFCKKSKSYRFWMGGAIFSIGILALLRGIADLNLVKHFILNPSADLRHHIIFF